MDIMPVRGLVRSKIWFSLKIGAINVKRVLKMVAEKAAIQLIKVKSVLVSSKEEKYKWYCHMQFKKWRL